MAPSDFVMTIDSDDEDVESKQVTKLKGKDVEAVQLDLDFVFDPSGDPYIDTLEAQSEVKDFIKQGSRPVGSFCFWK